jgi:hypothetical protein
MKKFLLGLLALATVSTVFTNCKKDDEVKGSGSVVFEFDNRFGDEALTYGKNYVTANGDTVNFSLFDYYVSNFVLVRADGSEYVVPQNDSYFLCKHEDADTREVTISNVPAGDYQAVRFLIGVDSLRSVSDVSQRTGVLDPTGAAAGMYWSWNAGYIFVKVEGLSPQAPINQFTGEHTVQYHTGLFGGKDSPTLNNLRTVTLKSTDELAKVREGKEAPSFHIYVSLDQMFTSPTTVSVAANPTSHGDAFSKTLVDNYVDMFTLDHVHSHE